MKAWLAALAFILLTRPDGKPIWIDPSQIVGILKAPDGACGLHARTQVLTLGGGLCVADEPRDVLDKVDAAGATPKQKGK